MLPEYGVPFVPGGGEVSVSVTPEGLIVIDTDPVVECAGFEESVAFTWNVVVPEAVGVPLSEQLAFSVRPAGGVPPSKAQVYGPVPPFTAMLPIYGVPTVPAGGDVIVSVIVAALMVIVTGLVLELAGELESVAFTETVTLPAVLGMPLIEQLAFSVNPAGIVPLVSAQV
jgi:hypothetical protein